MVKDWAELTRLTRGKDLLIERIRMPDSGISIEGEFTLPPLARLSADDQVFTMAFVSSHGSIKDMERLFGISYPTVKNRLDKLASQLEMVEFDTPPAVFETGSETLNLLENGKITVDEALRRLQR